jgi:hypothetical protein
MRNYDGDRGEQPEQPDVDEQPDLDFDELENDLLSESWDRIYQLEDDKIDLAFEVEELKARIKILEKSERRAGKREEQLQDKVELVKQQVRGLRKERKTALSTARVKVQDAAFIWGTSGLVVGAIFGGLCM